LESHGFQTRSVRNGSELKTALNWEPHFILYDLMLPELNALAFLKQAQAKDLLKGNQLRVFIMSGHTSPKNMQECARSGAAEYLTKPIQHEELLARLVFHLQEKREIKEVSEERLQAIHDQTKYFSHVTDLLLKEAVRRDNVEDCLHNITTIFVKAT
jgi:DNA-binding response OmpR family regulator